MGLYTSQSKDENIGKMEYCLKHPQPSLPTDKVRTKTTTVFYLSDQIIKRPVSNKITGKILAKTHPINFYGEQSQKYNHATIAIYFLSFTTSSVSLHIVLI
jgi:hypothetical protein